MLTVGVTLRPPVRPRKGEAPCQDEQREADVGVGDETDRQTRRARTITKTPRLRRSKSASCAAFLSRSNSRSTLARPALPSLSRSAGSRASPISALASAAASPGGTSSPDTPSSTSSGMPGQIAGDGGHAARQRLHQHDGDASPVSPPGAGTLGARARPRNRRARPRCRVRLPASWTRSLEAASAIRRSSTARSGPSPTMRHRKGTCDSARAAQASTRRTCPFTS